MSKNKNYSASKRAVNNTRNKVVNSYGYNISNFNVLDISVRRESKTGRLVSIKQASKRTLNDPS